MARTTGESGSDVERERQFAALRVLHEVTRASNEAESADEAVAAALRGVCGHDAWEVAHAWWVDDDDRRCLVSSDLWHPPEDRRFADLRAASADIRLGPGEGLAGRVVERGRPLHVADLAEFDDWRRGIAAELGVRAAMGFPVVVGGETVAVLEFFSSERLRDEPILRDVLADIAVQIGFVIERKRLEKQVASRTDRERQRLAQELHDTLGQQLAGLGMLATNLARHLEREGSARAGAAAKLVRELEQAKAQVRALTKGLLPVEIESDGLGHALRELVHASGQRTPGVEFRFVSDERPVEVADNFVATHLYRIAQEALLNATKHAGPSRVTVRLGGGDGIRLQVSDDGAGLPDPLPKGAGSGLRIMRYRAGLIGGRLEVASGPGGGTSVRCVVPRRGGSRGTPGPDGP